MVRFIVLFFTVACFAQVLTYTGFSKESQAKADAEAYAGIAKQVSSQISAETNVSRSEVIDGEKSNFRKESKTENQVRADISLKGVKIKHLKKQDDKFVSVATLDLGELTSAYRFKLTGIQKQVSEKESQALTQLENRDYENAIKSLDEVSKIARPYNKILDEMSLYIPIQESDRLITDSAEIRLQIQSQIKTLQLEIASEKLNVGENLEFEAKLQDSQGAVQGLSIFVEHNEKVVANAQTNSQGIAAFKIGRNQLLKKPHQLKVYVGGTLTLRQFAKSAKQNLDYDIQKSENQVHFICQENAAICSDIKNKLSDAGIEFSANAPRELAAKWEATLKRTKNQLSSYSVTINILEGENSLCTKTGNGVGRTKEESIRKGIGKMNFLSCVE